MNNKSTNQNHQQVYQFSYFRFNFHTIQNQNIPIPTQLHLQQKDEEDQSPLNNPPSQVMEQNSLREQEELYNLQENLETENQVVEQSPLRKQEEIQHPLNNLPSQVVEQSPLRKQEEIQHPLNNLPSQVVEQSPLREQKEQNNLETENAGQVQSPQNNSVKTKNFPKFIQNCIKKMSKDFPQNLIKDSNFFQFIDLDQVNDRDLNYVTRNQRIRYNMAQIFFSKKFKREFYLSRATLENIMLFASLLRKLKKQYKQSINQQI